MKTEGAVMIYLKDRAERVFWEQTYVVALRDWLPEQAAPFADKAIEALRERLQPEPTEWDDDLKGVFEEKAGEKGVA